MSKPRFRGLGAVLCVLACAFAALATPLPALAQTTSLLVVHLIQELTRRNGSGNKRNEWPSLFVDSYVV